MTKVRGRPIAPPPGNSIVVARCRAWMSCMVLGGCEARAELLPRRRSTPLDIEHDRSPVSPGDGSCISAHVWSDPDVPVSGGTALETRDLRRLLEWLEPNAAAWIALPRAEYSALRSEWGLP